MANNPYQYGNPVEPEHFVGRNDVVNQLATQLVYQQGRSVALVAGRRCGKTSTLFALADKLSQQEFIDSSSYHPFPIYFDMKGRPHCDDEEELLKHLLADVIDPHVSPDDFFGRPERAWPTAIELNNPKYQALKGENGITLYQFEGALRYILRLLEDETPTDAPVRLILLFDEVDSLLDEEWSDALFNRLRTLVSSGAVRKQVRVVLSGSTQFLAKTSERGSPLWNILDTHYLQPFDEEGFQALSGRFEDLPDDVETAVLDLGGGHPFLEQYLLYYLWEDRESALNAASADEIASRFFLSNDGAMHLQAWANAVDTAGLLLFMYLANKSDWVETKTLYSELANEAPADVDAACMALNFHCFIERDKSWRHFRARCGLLQRWLDLNFKAILEQENAANAPDIVAAALERAKERGNVTIIMGDQYQLEGDFRNSIINIKSTLDKASQSVAEMGQGSSDLRQQVRSQIESVMKLLEQVPEAYDELAERIAKRINSMVESATETRPDKEFVQTLSKGVENAAAELAEALPELPKAIDKLNGLVLQLIN